RPPFEPVALITGKGHVTLLKRHDDAESQRGVVFTADLGPVTQFSESAGFQLVLSGAVDGLVANLPYVEDGEWAGLAPEVRREPRAALLGGPDGLDIIRRFVPQAARVLRPGGGVFLEVGRGQAPAVATLVSGYFRDVRTEKDFAGIDRYVGGRR
ncbi:MAG TPA: hypothetical protein PKA08_10185, partial [Elusimicrobiota bacterium]|nr:hypothetical protein [Elusimicrobiota bacterium]